MIKSEFWTSEQIIFCSPLARLLFIGLWNFADDNGVYPASYVKLKAQVLSADNFSIEEIKGLISQLIEQGLLREYAVNDKSYWIVTGWKSHQKIEKPTYRYPLPQSELTLISPTFPQLPNEHSMNISRAIDPVSGNSIGIVDEYLSTGSDEIEKKEKRKKKEKHISEVKTSPVDVLTLENNAVTQLFEYWQRTMNHSLAKLDKKRKRTIEQALKLGYTISALKQAIDGCKNTPYNMGKNDRQQLYDDIGLILRDAEHIERFIGNANKNEAQFNYMKSDDIMAGVI